MPDERYDVLIVEIATRKVDTIAGRNLKAEGRYNSAESRMDVVLTRLSDSFTCLIVSAGKYKKGDILPALEFE